MARRNQRSSGEATGAAPDAPQAAPAATPEAEAPPALPPVQAPVAKVRGVKPPGRFRCIYNVNRPERSYSPNEIITGLSDADAARLLALGAIKSTE